MEEVFSGRERKRLKETNIPEWATTADNENQTLAVDVRRECPPIQIPLIKFYVALAEIS